MIIVVQYEDQNKRLDNYLLARFKNLSRSLVFKYIRDKKIKVNDKKANYAYRLQLGDKIELKVLFNSKPLVLRDLFLECKLTIDILYEDENIALINKPIGIISQEDKNEKINTINNMFKKYMFDSKQWTNSSDQVFVPNICNRLDKNTSGIIIAAKNNKALITLNKLIKDHKIQKYYKCLVHGKPAKKHDILQAYLYKDSSANKVYISNTAKKNYKYIKTEYKLLKSNEKISMLEVLLHTGRTHQIRAHLNSVNLPLLGDQKYMQKQYLDQFKFKTQALVSYKIVFLTEPDSYLNYLNQKEFTIKNIWFEKMIKW